jgi:uncharacterized membrane protein YagU involved in acid resistance
MQREEEQESYTTKMWKFIFVTGFFAGVIWGGIDVIMYYLKFTKIIPAIEWRLFYTEEFLNNWVGHILGLVGNIMISIGAAALYAIALLRFRGPWVGIAYGALWGLLGYGLVGPFLHITPPLWRIDINSLATELSIFILWGLFIGYSLVVELTNEQGRRGIV